MFIKNLRMVGVGLLLTSLYSCSFDSLDADKGKPEENNARIQEHITQNNLTGKVKPTTTGLYYYIATPTTSANAKSPKLGEEVEFTYVLSLLNGQKVDSATTTRPVYVPFGLGAVVPGLEEGLSLMKEGETSVLLMPYYIGYGSADKKDSSGRVLIPAYTPIRFDVKLVSSRSEDQQIEEYVQKQGLTVNAADKLASGVRVVRNPAAPGTGETLRGGQNVTVNYTGKLLRTGKVFDSNSKGTFKFTLGSSQTIPGFNEGISRLKKGEKATLIFPSTVAYGNQGSHANGNYIIPPYSPLRFDVEVVDAQ
ncbi:FKBP-type peptidyl-prolyl cis-trans isomerase [Tellurirhabdus bombi]|uniref:FKBP-type peptidyl-prolyl cis-trans isomerase n=1 Tax=Tellurirhabdus bombi TaxID=2907205 RepID=UPI001F44103B|nr:FKBP-type peptidyl-prolyl cis-trans isomerase [Tellurirhabdus bombi]